MFRKIFCIFAVICIFVSSFALSSSAAVTFTSTLVEPVSYLDDMSRQHDFFALYGSSYGILIDVIYPSPAVSTSVIIANNDYSITFSNLSSVALECYVVCRSLSNGRLLFEEYIKISGSSSRSTTFSNPSGSLTGDVANAGSFSHFEYYVSFDTLFTLSSLNSRFSFGSIVFTSKFSEEGYILSPLTEPLSDVYNRFVVMANDNNAFLYNVSLYFPNDIDSSLVDVFFQIDSYGDYQLSIINKSSGSIRFTISVYDISNGFLSNSEYAVLGAGLTQNVIFSLRSVVSFPAVKVYGMTLINSYGYNVSLPKILWNYDLLLAQGIASQTALLLTQLYSINRYLSDILNNLTLDLPYIQELLTRIYDLFDRVYNSEGESYTQPPTDALDDYLSDESKVYDVLPTGMQQYIDSAFGQADVDFSGNGAFGLIRSLMQSMIFDDPRLSSLVFFALAIGIAVLILGRKVNA